MKLNKKALKVAKEESLLGFGMVLVSAGSYSLIAGEYVSGLVCISAGLGILYLRGFLKK